MSKIKKLFGEIDMTWKKVILFAVITGVYTGLINLVPFLNDTSFQDIAVTTEWWVFFAVIIAANCKKPVESGLKIFAFFLISQPLVYLIETPFLGIGVWSYYKYWAIITILTLPGGMIANLIRKKNIVGTLVLSVALCIVAMNASEYAFRVITTFPHHVLTVVFCVVEIIVLIICLIPRNSFKALAATLVILAFASSTYISANAVNTVSVSLPEGTEWTCTFDHEDTSTLTNDGYSITLNYKKAFVKDNTIICKDKNGKTVTYKVVVNTDRTVDIVEK